jgi:glutathione S-transferase
MKFYDFDVFAPNPWTVWIFAREKGLRLERVVVDLLARENRREPFLSTINPMGELPALQLDDGRVITEVTAICEYLEEMRPAPPLIGSTAFERAETRQWVRRIDQRFAEPMGEGFSMDEGRAFFEADYQREGVRMLKPLLPPGSGAALKAKAHGNLLWLDGLMRGRMWVCGGRFSLADIFLYCFLQFGENHGQPIPAECEWALGFFARFKARPTAWHGKPGSLD